MEKRSPDGRLRDDLLERYGAMVLPVDREEVIFSRGDEPRFFYVLKEGEVKMTVLHESGREFVQGYFEPGESFGEPPFFAEEPYPAAAIAVKKSEVWRLTRSQFDGMLDDHPDLYRGIVGALSRRLLYKSVMLSELAIEEAAHRVETILAFLHQLKGSEKGAFVVPYTRQEIADLTGLRVETVIRIVKALEAKGELSISRGKVVLPPSDR